MSPREIAETLGILAAAAVGMWGLRKATQESVGLSDETARKLREDLSAMDRLTRRLRSMLHTLEVWVIDHMRSVHDEPFNPGDVYQEDNHAD